MEEKIIYSTDTDQLKGLLNGRESFAIVDKAMKGQPFLKRFGRNIIYLEASEKMKKMATVEKIAKKMMSRGVDRTWLLVGVGGGIVTDIAGFVAAIYMRGIACGLVPTTLLAQVDAALGGKNGVNLDGYKNMLGTIREPEFVYICPTLTETLDPQERLCGIAEMLKTFIIGDAEYYTKAVDHFSSKQACDEMDLIRRAGEIKCGIVGRDLREGGERRLLNLGHTFGHAIEKCGGRNAMPHGLAVAVGIIFAARIASQIGELNDDVRIGFEEDWAKLGLPTTTEIPSKKLISAIKKDKKGEGDHINFVLPKEIGTCIVKRMTVREIANLIGK